MKNWTGPAALLALCCLATLGFTQEAKEGQRIDELVEQLGSSKYADRDRAQKEIEALGEKALPALKKAAQGSDLEARRRAMELFRKLEEKIATAAILAPKKVHLKVTDASVLDAVNQLSKLSGYPVRLEGDQAALANKKITLDTGMVSFFEALDRLSAAAGLVEKHGVVSAPGVRDKPIKIRPPIRVQPVPVQPLQPLPALPVQPRVKPVAPRIAPAPVQDAPGQPAPVQPAAAQPVPAPAEVEQAAPAKRVRALPAPAVPAPAAPAARVAQVQVQAQIQAAAPIQVQPILPGGRLRPGVADQITLVPGKPSELPTSYAGAVRFRLVPRPDNFPVLPEPTLFLEVIAEPRLQGFTLQGSPSVTSAVDDQGQNWRLAMNDQPKDPALPPNVVINGNVVLANMVPNHAGQRVVPLRFQRPARKSEVLRELAGSVTAKVQLPPEPLLTVNNVLKAAGQTAKGEGNGAMTLQAIEPVNKGIYRVRVSLENMQNQNGFGNVQIIGNAQVQIRVGGVGLGGLNNSALPQLLDAKGNAYKMQQITQRALQINNGVFQQSLTLQYQADGNQGEPDRLVLVGTRTTNISIPFQFQNVPLP